MPESKIQAAVIVADSSFQPPPFSQVVPENTVCLLLGVRLE